MLVPIWRGLLPRRVEKTNEKKNFIFPRNGFRYFLLIALVSQLLSLRNIRNIFFYCYVNAVHCRTNRASFLGTSTLQVSWVYYHDTNLLFIIQINQWYLLNYRCVPIATFYRLKHHCSWFYYWKMKRIHFVRKINTQIVWR